MLEVVRCSSCNDSMGIDFFSHPNYDRDKDKIHLGRVACPKEDCEGCISFLKVELKDHALIDYSFCCNCGCSNIARLPNYEDEEEDLKWAVDQIKHIKKVQGIK